jgi:predicted lipid-binding transport protein (Tim44 family)
MDLLIFALLTGYLFFRLWSVLGTRTGSEKKRYDIFNQPAEEEENVVILPPVREVLVRQDEEADLNLRSEISALENSDSTFKEDKFLNGAKIILVKIITAFSKGDLEFLKKFTASNVYGVYEKAIRQREELGQVRESLVENVEARIIEVNCDNPADSRIRVEFTSDQKIVTFEKDGSSYDNPSGLTVKTKDVWEFSKDIQSSDPTWRLVSTKTAQV